MMLLVATGSFAKVLMALKEAFDIAKEAKEMIAFAGEAKVAGKEVYQYLHGQPADTVQAADLKFAQIEGESDEQFVLIDTDQMTSAEKDQITQLASRTDLNPAEKALLNKLKFEIDGRQNLKAYQNMNLFAANKNVRDAGREQPRLQRTNSSPSLR